MYYQLLKYISPIKGSKLIKIKNVLFQLFLRLKNHLSTSKEIMSCFMKELNADGTFRLDGSFIDKTNKNGSYSNKLEMINIEKSIPTCWNKIRFLFR